MAAQGSIQQPAWLSQDTALDRPDASSESLYECSSMPCRLGLLAVVAMKFT